MHSTQQNDDLVVKREKRNSIKKTKINARKVLIGAGARVLFYPTLLYNVLRFKIQSDFRWWNQVDQYLLLGAVPFPKDVPRLKQLGVGGVITLNEPFETLVPSSMYKVIFGFTCDLFGLHSAHGSTPVRWCLVWSIFVSKRGSSRPARSTRQSGSLAEHFHFELMALLRNEALPIGLKSGGVSRQCIRVLGKPNIGPKASKGQAHGMDHLVVPTRDYLYAPSFDDINRAVDFIHNNASCGRATYVHCKAGRGRSTTIALCYMVKYKQMTPSTAMDLIRGKRPRVLLTSMQAEAVQQYYRSCNPVSGHSSSSDEVMVTQADLKGYEENANDTMINEKEIVPKEVTEFPLGTRLSSLLSSLTIACSCVSMRSQQPRQSVLSS